MGFGDVSGPLTSQLQSDFSLSNFEAGLVTFMAFIMFGLLSVPMGLFQDRKGRKHVLLLGLFAALIGMILPIIGKYESFILILGGLLFMGTGATLLQVAGNPIMRDVSPEGKYSRNLSFGQFVKAIGSLSGSLIPIVAARYWGLDWKILFPIYGGVILNWLSPKRFLIFTSILSILGIAGLFIVPSQILAFVFIFIIGLGFANIFPLIFSMTVDALPERSNEISGLMVTAIIGGTNFVFNAFQRGKAISKGIRKDAHADHLERCLATMKDGFREVMEEIGKQPVAISFAFPGPPTTAMESLITQIIFRLFRVAFH